MGSNKGIPNTCYTSPLLPCHPSKQFAMYAVLSVLFYIIIIIIIIIIIMAGGGGGAGVGCGVVIVLSTVTLPTPPTLHN